MFYQLQQVFTLTAYRVLEAWRRRYTPSRLLFVLIIPLMASFVLFPFGQQKAYAAQKKYVPGVVVSGNVRWYAYNMLEQSNYQQVNALLHRAAAYYGLPANLVLAIARQESGFQQHIIARDGGIGVMQIMPSTAMSINQIAGSTRDPYKVQDNIFMGTFYLRTLCNYFHGNLPQAISAYNEGAWAVAHRGIFNWHYVNNVMAMMRNFR